MGQNYEQLSLEERCTLCRLSQAGKTIRQIAAAMDRAPSTIMRELKRNTGSQVGYQPAYADKQAKSRRWKGSRLLRDPDLRASSHPAEPRLVAAQCRSTEERTDGRSSAMSRSIGSSTPRSAAPRTTAGGTTCRGGKQARLARSQRRELGGSYRGACLHRSAPGLHRQAPQPGHWEADLMLFAKYGQALLMTHERHSRLLCVSRQPSKAAEP